MAKSFGTISQLSLWGLKIFRNIEFGIAVVKQMFFPLRKNRLR